MKTKIVVLLTTFVFCFPALAMKERCFATFDEVEALHERLGERERLRGIIAGLALEDHPFLYVPPEKESDDAYIADCLKRAIDRLRKRNPPPPPLGEEATSLQPMLVFNDSMHVPTLGLGLGRPADGNVETWIEAILAGATMGNALVVPIARGRALDLHTSLAVQNDPPPTSGEARMETMTEAADLAGQSQKDKGLTLGELIRLREQTSVYDILVDQDGNAVLSLGCEMSRKEKVFQAMVNVMVTSATAINDAPMIATHPGDESKDGAEVVLVTCPGGVSVSAE